MYRNRMRHTSLILCLYLLGFLSGILFVDLQWKNRSTDILALNLYFVSDRQALKYGFWDYFLWLLPLRLRVPAAICLAGCLSIGIAAACLSTLALGFLGGMLLTLALLCRGLQGMLRVFLTCLFPMLVYTPVLVMLFQHVITMSESVRLGRIYGISTYRNYLLQCLIDLLGFTAGIVLESLLATFRWPL